MYKANKIKGILALAAVAASLSVVATVMWRSHGGKPPALVRKLPVQVDVSLQGIHYTESKEGVKQWDLAADRAEYNKDSNKTTLYGVKLTVAGSKAGELRISAARADYDNASRDVFLSGGVQGEGSRGMRFSTTHLKFVAARSQLETEALVRFSDAGLAAEGVGMVFHTKTRRLQLMRQVSATIQGKAGR